MRADRLASNRRGSFPRLVVLLGCLGAMFGAVAVGCGLDDSGVTVLGEDATGGAKDASIVDTGTLPPIGEGGTPDTGPTCTPKTCAAYPGDCHSSLDDGCSGKLDCSATCPSGQACVGDAGVGNSGGAYCNGPPVCMDAGAAGGNCGTLTNVGTGQMTTCAPSTCTNTGYTCNSNVCTCATGGTVCGAICCSGTTPNCNAGNTACCKKKTCAADYVGKCANNADDGCGGTLDCTNNCSAGTFCGPTNKACGAKPTCNNMGQPNGDCGTITDSTSGLSQDCGTCQTANYTCNASNKCTCTADTTAVTCANKCGTVNNNCGTPVSCGDCDFNEQCLGSSNCKCGIVSVCTPNQFCCKDSMDHHVCQAACGG